MTVAPLAVSVRSATPDDLSFITEATAIARSAIEDVRGGAVELALTEPDTSWGDRYTRALDAADQIVLIGQVDEVPVGFARAAARSTVSGGTICHVHEIFVRPEGRGVGVGAELLRSLVAFGRDRDCVGIDARALPGDRETKNFFESFGLVARSLAVHASID